METLFSLVVTTLLLWGVLLLKSWYYQRDEVDMVFWVGITAGWLIVGLVSLLASL